MLREIVRGGKRGRGMEMLRVMRRDIWLAMRMERNL